MHAQTGSSAQVLVEYQDWPALVSLALQRPGERGQHLDAALHALARAAASEPEAGVEVHIQAILTAIAADPALSETLTPLSVIGTLQVRTLDPQPTVCT